MECSELVRVLTWTGAHVAAVDLGKGPLAKSEGVEKARLVTLTDWTIMEGLVVRSTSVRVSRDYAARQLITVLSA